MSKPTNVFVAVHAGAGNHSLERERNYRSVCRQACLQAMQLLWDKKSAVEAVTSAVVALEDAKCTNAGKGSNLTIQGSVECDASVMDGDSLFFGAVGALSGVVNPVTAARKLVEEQKLGLLPCGRIRPSILVGHGAENFCQQVGIGTHENLVSRVAYKTYSHYKRKCQKAEMDEYESCPKKKKDESGNSVIVDTQSSLVSPKEDFVQDTVGAVCMDYEGNVAAASSSGGIWLKHSGRLGPAAIYGAGCWAQNQRSKVKAAVASVTSGCGEHLIQTTLAKTCSDAIRSTPDLTQSLTDVFCQSFLDSEFLESKGDKFGGVLTLRASEGDCSKEVELSWIHSTASMCLGYMAGNETQPTTSMSRLHENCVPGQSYTIGGHFVNLK